jgi:hypothetical protein
MGIIMLSLHSMPPDSGSRNVQLGLLVSALRTKMSPLQTMPAIALPLCRSCR